MTENPITTEAWPQYAGWPDYQERLARWLSLFKYDRHILAGDAAAARECYETAAEMIAYVDDARIASGWQLIRHDGLIVGPTRERHTW